MITTSGFKVVSIPYKICITYIDCHKSAIVSDIFLEKNHEA